MRQKRSNGSYQRRSKSIRPSPFFIIVCEGEVTEEDYFKSFPYYHSLGKGNLQGQLYEHKAVHIEAGAGQHIQVVKRAEKVFNEFIKKYGTVKPSEVWCVFDCDNDIIALKLAVEAAKKKDLMLYIQFNVSNCGIYCILNN